MTTLKKGTRLYHITGGDIPTLSNVPTYFALTPLNAACMAPLHNATAWDENLGKALYVLTLTEDTTFYSEDPLKNNYIGPYSDNQLSQILADYGYRVQELVVHSPAKHKWERVADNAVIMPSIQLFLTKYPIWSELEKPLERMGRRVYHFYDYQWKQMETNFKMKTLEELDEAQKNSIENAHYWRNINKEENGKKIKAFTNARMSVKQQLGSWEEFSREKSKYVRLHKAGSMVPKHLLLDIQSPEAYVVITTVPSSTEYLAKINELTPRIRQLNKLIPDLEDEYDDNFDKEIEKRLQTLKDERISLKEEVGKLRRKEKERKAAVRRAMKPASLKLKF